MARPRTYRKAYDEQARKLCLLGYTDVQLADFFGVTERTINRWKKDFPSFCQCLKAGKDVADAEVADSLYRRAIGYSHPDTDIRAYEGQIIMTPIVKHYAPDTTAALAWLHNRQRDNWKPRKAFDGDDGPTDRPDVQLNFNVHKSDG